MRLWMYFVLMTVLCWGAYVPVLHEGQQGFGKNGALRAFLFVGLAYFVLAAVILALIVFRKAEPLEFAGRAVSYSFIAGVLGAVGALGIVFALRNQGTPSTVVPLVFAGAPIVGTLVGMIWHRPQNMPGIWFYLGILMAAGGASMVLYNKPH